ncbi:MULTISPECIES: ferredoxin [Streptomyces]|uniref:Ferredoxin n=1 Tax=Streptomyces violaceoruber TaxID=1935 RepID=A0A1V0UKU4_STRVN|nr:MULTISPECIES: ferredoxin [Streptomyces]MYW77817.1 ferredoxin [Streptomyces sp. SID8369]NEA13742.1 ferredoxin [Streptomyces sp. SID10692]NEC45087.1 ferredoxin [Streptomyces sp. SID8016]ARF65869.1 ferredoxin [Streptomyces violaceoruber]KOG81148.1 ferredoxin [Streptomyces griseus subsp. rhodochrous]
MSGVDVQVNRERCVGAGMCALTAPEVFTQDDDGFSEVRPGGTAATAGHPLVRDAARACPVGAVTLTDD